LRISDIWRRLVTHFLYLVRHGEADPHDGPLSEAGVRQAQLTGQRLKDVPFGGIYHGPLLRAAQTAGLIAASLPGVPVCACDLAGFAGAELADGPELAAAALERFARAGGEQEDTHELIVTHNFLIGGFVSQALGAPPWRWIGLNQMNCALTVIAYLPGPGGAVTRSATGRPGGRARR